MCVIMLASKVRPSDYMIEKAFEGNGDGGGTAWREGEEGKKEVVWSKGLDLKQMKEISAIAPFPYVLHFRIASIGGVRPSLTHPFPITPAAPTLLDGRTKGHVLFHNGHWKEWADESRHAAIHSNTKIPQGKWSDTRAMAWLCSIYGNSFMDFLPHQKGITFGPEDMQIFYGDGWPEINGVYCSNDYFMTKVRHFPMGRGSGLHGKFCRFGTCTFENIDSDGYCPKHPGGKFKAPDAISIALKAEPRGVQQPVPFPVLAQGETLTLEVAERLHKEVDLMGKKKLSKNCLKRVRQLYSDLASKKGRKADRAIVELASIQHSLSSGSGLVH